MTNRSSGNGDRIGRATALGAVLFWAGSMGVDGAIFTVTTRADGGSGSLRWAIDQANGNPGPDDIHFNIPGPGPHIIELDSQLPHIDGHGTEIRGDTQPGYSNHPLVALNGARFGVVPFSLYRGGGLIFYGNDCRVRGLAFGGFRMQPGQASVVQGGWHEYDEEHSCAVRLHGDNGRVEDCFFGMDVTGAQATQNGLDAGNATGVLIRGGTCRVERNYFGLNQQGVWLFDHRPGATVQSNQFGLFFDGLTPASQPNSEGAFAGQGIKGIAARSVLIQGNRFAALGFGVGVSRRGLEGPLSSSIQVLGNEFGLGRDGRALAMNIGVYASGTSGLQIGSDSAPNARNHFCSHTPFTRTYTDLGGRTTVYRGDSPAVNLGRQTEAVVAGNTFGENLAGQPRPNGDTAVTVRSDHRIATTATIRGNRITHSRIGIAPSSRPTDGYVTTVLRENVFLNLTGMAIDNDEDGPTPPDALDGDTGANGLQNQPEIQTITYDSVSDRTRVTGVLRSLPGSRYTLELVRMPMAAANPPEAHVSVATQVVTTDGFGLADFTFNTPGLFVGQAFSATATPADAIVIGSGGTSELADAMVAPSGRFRLTGGGAMTEGAGSSRTLTVSRNGTYGPASVRLQISGSDPGANASDYVLSEGPVLHFANGEASKSITVQAADDVINEPFEIYTVELTELVNGLSANGVAVFSIADNDVLPILSVADGTVTEGEQAVLRLRLSAASQRAVTADYVWWNASALFGEDFINVFNGTATFPPGVTEVVVTADTVDDATAELSEWFGFSLANVVNASLAPESARIIQITINDNDTPPNAQTGFRFSWATPNVFVSEGDGEVGLTILRTGSLVGEARVWLRRTAGTASAADFTPNTDVELVFASGENAKIVPLGVVNDALDEPDETFFTTLFNPSASIGTAALETHSSLTFTITDNDSPPTLKAETLTKAEGDFGITHVEIAVNLSAPSGRELVIGLRPEGGTATLGEDYLPILGSVTLAPGQLSGVFTVDLVGDRIDEAPETIVLEPVVLIGGTHPVGAGVFTIDNDDPSKPTYALEDLPLLIPESAGTLTLTLRRFGNIADAGTCRVKVGEGDASLQLDETDYDFEPGQETRIVTLRVMDDALDELDENGSLVLLPVSPGEAPVSTYPVLIVDDDDPPALFVEGPARMVERDASDVTATAAVRLSGPSRLPVEVKLITTGISATEGVDYEAVSTVLQFAPGETSRTLELTVHGDRTDEGDEEFLLLAISAANATFGSGGLRVLIEDNDLPLRPYRDWLNTHFTPAERREVALTAPCADPDGDGLGNAVEFYLDSDPRVPGSGSDRMILARNSGSMTWVIDGRSSRAAFAEPTLTESDNLRTWEPLRRAEETVADLPGDVRRHKVFAAFTEPRLFFRFRAVCREFEAEP